MRCVCLPGLGTWIMYFIGSTSFLFLCFKFRLISVAASLYALYQPPSPSLHYLSHLWKDPAILLYSSWLSQQKILSVPVPPLLFLHSALFHYMCYGIKSNPGHVKCWNTVKKKCSLCCQGFETNQDLFEVKQGQDSSLCYKLVVVN